MGVKGNLYFKSSYYDIIFICYFQFLFFYNLVYLQVVDDSLQDLILEFFLFK